MQKWEYLFASVDEGGVLRAYGQPQALGIDLKSFLTKVGEEGWELVSTIVDRYGVWSLFFKRPKQEK
jgi:hypothetical protein